MHYKIISPEEKIRGHAAFDSRMYLANVEKQRMLDFIPADAQRIMEFGCGTGNILELLSLRFPQAELWGIEMEADFISLARSRSPSTHLVTSDILKWKVPKEMEGTFDAVLLSSMLHEIDYPHGLRAGEKVIQLAEKLLRSGGKIILRDGVKPHDHTAVEIEFKTSYACFKFKRFIEDYSVRKIIFAYIHHSEQKIQISRYDLQDFLCKFYFEGELWSRDMHETFGSRSLKGFQELFSLHFNVQHSETFIASYLKPLWDENFYSKQGFPDSHILIVGEKPKQEQKAPA